MAEHYIAPIPRDNPVVRPPRSKDDQLAYLTTEIWGDYLDRRTDTLNRKATAIFSRTLENQTASVATFDLTDGALGSGTYRLSCYQQINRAASTSSSLQVVVTWTNNSVTQTKTFTAVTGNTSATYQDDRINLFRMDSNTPVNVTITYASVGATTMRYDCYLALERVPL